MNKFLFYVLFSCTQTIAPAPPEELVIVMGGQSNCGNTRFTSGLSATAYSSYPGTYSNVHYIDNVHYLTRTVYSRESSASIRFGADLGIVKNLPTDYDIEIIKAWVDGTPLKYFGNVNTFYPNISGGYFNSLYYKNDNSSFWQTNLAAISETKPNAIIWIQGEFDANQNSTTYLSDLTAFVQAIRDGYNDQTIPFFYNQLHEDYSSPSPPVPGLANIRAAQASFQGQYNIMINMDDVAIGDPANVHYDAPALAEMGKRFADAIKEFYNIN